MKYASHRISVRDSRLRKAARSSRWIPYYFWRRLVYQKPRVNPVHLIIGVADHFEPSFVPNVPHGTYVELGEQERRVERWCREYSTLIDPFRDHDGRPFRRTYFFPAEQSHRSVLERLAEHCAEGWGEIEIHLHHGVECADTAANTRRVILRFRDMLEKLGCLSRMDGVGAPRYAFVHGNWALANSGNGGACGVDNEMQILAETGCYGDFTLPSAPDVSQVAKVNSLYECGLPMHQRAPHRRGSDLVVGRSPKVFPLMIQGPLVLDFENGGRAWSVPRIENSNLTTRNPPTMRRLNLWKDAAITVRGRPEWIFIKLHCHGMDPGNAIGLLGEPMRTFLRDLVEGSSAGRAYGLHFVTAREMVNIVLAACDGRTGDPGNYRDYRLKPNIRPAT